MAAQVAVKAAEIEKQFGDVVGRTVVYLNGDVNNCRMRECNMGNLIADAFVHCHLVRSSTGSHTGWTQAAIGVYNGGGIRASIDESMKG